MSPKVCEVSVLFKSIGESWLLGNYKYLEDDKRFQYIKRGGQGKDCMLRRFLTAKIAKMSLRTVLVMPLRNTGK